MKTATTAKVLVIGASTKPSRYSNMVIQRLVGTGYPVEALSLKSGEVAGVVFQTGMPEISDIDTVTLYVNPERLEQFRGYIIGLKPRRVIFNPGTEFSDFEAELRSNGIEAVEACTLVLLSTGMY
jgi:predicted CoA-binding protein